MNGTFFLTVGRVDKEEESECATDTIRDWKRRVDRGDLHNEWTDTHQICFYARISHTFNY